MSLAHNGSAWLEALDRHAAQRPGAIAITQVTPDNQHADSITWSHFAEMSEARARALAAAAAPGDPMVCALPSGIDLASWFAGAIRAGVRLVLMHARCGAAEFASVVQRSRAQCVLAPNELLVRIDPRAHRIALDTSQQSAPAHVRRPPGGIVIGSSGTTGLPKLVIRESPALDADAIGVARAMSLTPDDVLLCIPPLCHSYGVDLLLGALYAGAELRIMTEYVAPAAAAQLRSSRDCSAVSVLPGVPFVFESLARLDPGAARLRLAVSAGAPLNQRVRETFTQRWGVEVGQLYGATELGTVALNRPDEAGFDPSSIGRPLPGVSFRILDPVDPSRILGAGEEGELAVRAPSMLSGYFGDTLKLIDNHLPTGDLARIDRDGRATITGRLKLLIDTGGFKVNPLEVEAALMDHPAVRDCAVVAMPLSDTIQRLGAVVSVHDTSHPPSDRELREFLRERLAPIKIPRSFEFVADLPRTVLGKINRDGLALRALENQS